MTLFSKISSYSARYGRRGNYLPHPVAESLLNQKGSQLEQDLSHVKYETFSNLKMKQHNAQTRSEARAQLGG